MRTPPRLRHPSARCSAGFTLIEVLLATVLIVLAIASSEAVFTSASAKYAYADDSLSARQLAREIHKLAQTLPRKTVATTVVTTFAGIEAFGSLHGASFSPPIMADGTEISGLTGWTQSVSLEIVNLDSPGTGELSDPHQALAVEAPCLYRLAVTILQDQVEVDTYHWWLRL